MQQHTTPSQYTASTAGQLAHVLPVLPPLIAAFGALILVTAGGWSLGIHEWWAFNFLIYVPLSLRDVLAVLLIASALLTPPKRYSAAWRAYGERWTHIPLALIVPLALILFWLLRERTWHGDARYKVYLLEHVPLQMNPYVWKEPLNSLLEYAFASLAGWVQRPPWAGVAFLSVLAGGVYVVSVWLGAKWLFERASQRRLFAVAMFASGGSLLWFGHIENYSWSTATTLLMLVAAIGAIQGRIPLMVVGLVAGTAASLHPQSLFALPALLFVLQKDRWLRQFLTLALSGVFVPLVTGGLFVVLKVPPPDFSQGFATDPQLFFTFSQAVHPAQLGQALQNLWLLAPLWPLWMLAAVWVWRSSPLRRDRLLHLMTAAVVGLLFYFFAFQNDLPRWRDWDLYAIVGPPLTLWGVYAWSQLTAQLTARANLPRAAISHLSRTLRAGLSFALSYTLLWVGVNARLTLLHPIPNERAYYAPYKVIDLIDRWPTAHVTPNTPLCAEPVGCERAAITEFTMPQNGDHRPTIFAHAPAAITFPLTLPAERTFLWLSPALDPQAWEWGGDGVTFIVKVRTPAGEDVLWQQHLDPTNPADRDWQQAIIPLYQYAGETIELILVTDPGPVGNDAADRAGWGMPWLMRGTYDLRSDF